MSRWTGLNTKRLKDRLGNPETLPSIDAIKTEINERMTDRLQGYVGHVKNKASVAFEPLRQRKQALVKLNRQDRLALVKKQEARWQDETIVRSQQLPRGLKGILCRITGKYHKIKTIMKKRQGAATSVTAKNSRRSSTNSYLNDKGCNKNFTQ